MKRTILAALAALALTGPAWADGPPVQCGDAYCVTGHVRDRPEAVLGTVSRDAAILIAKEYRADGIPAEVWTSYGKKIWPPEGKGTQ